MTSSPTWSSRSQEFDEAHRRLLHVSLNRPRFKDEDMQQFKVLQRPLRA
ncbi:hypothetical protein GHK48_29325 [Sinorhizobium fredii]|uniref:Uncharacterized protein n=1 Tax=Rhizobium fredii TaxID=380 RepID=A0A844AM45_RHIFR|nr:hypothetical protein [Sinorhizobium fredii]MQX12216.1 hypothetical protein [Sinorhizobium fredii]